MEISAALKTDILTVQGEIVKAIQDHTNSVLKLKEFPNLENQIKQDLFGIQRHIVELNEKQKTLLQQLRKEIKEATCNSGVVPVYNFNLYKIKPGQLESKKSRRKDLNLAPKIVTCRPTHSPPSLSPSPTPSSSSSLSDDSIEYVSPFMLPVPLPKPRPLLLPDIKDNQYLDGVSRRELRPPKLKRNQKPLSDEEVFKDIPIYNDPLPSPPPTDEKDLKARFMTALSLISKEMHNEILNRKVERKRRSTATNNPNFVYNNDWEIPPWKRSRTYLSPHKIGKIEVTGKKIKSEDSDGKHYRKDKDGDSDKSGRIYLDGYTGEKLELKSRNSTPDSTNSGALCFICHTSGLLNVCKDCNVCYHLSCVSPNSSVSCPYCKSKRLSPDGGSSENSSKEEFVSKCPNVAESYNKLKEYIENHTDSDTAALYSERENVKMELVSKNQELYSQKRELEEKAAELSEALLLQEDAKNNLLKEEANILAKIKVITDFVSLYQKTNEKKKIKDENEGKENEEVKEGEDGEPAIECEKQTIENREREEKGDEEEEEREKPERDGTDDEETSLGTVGTEKLDEKGKEKEKGEDASFATFQGTAENFDEEASREIDRFESPSTSPKERPDENALFELEEGERGGEEEEEDEEEEGEGEGDGDGTDVGGSISQSVDCSVESDGTPDYESPVD